MCGDNIDKTVRSRYMRMDKRTRSMHYFHSYAVLNRIPTKHLPNTLPPGFQLSANIASSVLPSPEDDRAIRKNIATIIARVLTQQLDFFKFTFLNVVERHIEHKFSKEMSKKSTVVRIKSIYLHAFTKLNYVYNYILKYTGILIVALSF